MNELNKDVIKFKFKQDAINVKVSCLLDEDFAKTSSYTLGQKGFICLKSVLKM